MAGLRLPPDIEAVAIQWLLAHPDVQVSDPPIHVTDTLDERRPVAVIKRVGGVHPVRGYLLRARIDVDTYAPDSLVALDAARLTQAALLQAKGAVAGAWVTNVDIDVDLFPLPDPDTGEPRYTFTAALYAHPNVP